MTRNNPEAALQITVKQFLTYCLPDSIYWTASLTGTPLTIRARTRAKAMGVRRGLPDLLFVFPDGVTRYIELKAGSGLSEEQRDFRDRCYAAERALGFPIWALCRSVGEVEASLRLWGAELKSHPFHSTDEAA